MRFLTCATSALIAFFPFFSAVFAVAADAPVFSPKTRALLVSLESYSGNPLKYVDEDLAALQRALDAFGCETKIVRDVTRANQDDPKKDFERDVADWCARLRPDETAILYLAGHGVKDETTGKLYVPMLNFLDAPVERRYRDAAVPFSWIRERFEAADCKNRVVFIDACHSGAVSRAFDDEIVSASPVREFVVPSSRNVDAASRVTVLASSSEEQKSWLWDAQKSSLFTYWLVKGLSGYADENGDFSITLDELKTYVVDRVENVSSSPVYRMERQTPILYNEAANATFELPRPARKAPEATKYCAEFLDRRLRKHARELGAENVRVAFEPAFKTASSGSRVDAATYGTFPQTVVSNLLTELTLGDDAGLCEIVETSVDLDDARALDQLAADESLDAAVSGSVVRSSPTTLTLRIKLTTFKKDGASGKLKKSTNLVSEKIWLTKGDRALLGDAFVARPADATPEKTPNASSTESFVLSDDGAVSLADYDESAEIAAQISEERNPIDDPESPFKAQIRVANARGQFELREGKTFNGKRYVPLDVGETYEILLTNRFADADGCYVRLFVDGLNTLSEARPENRNMAAADPDSTTESAPRVLDPEKARPWYLERMKTHAVKGFTDKKAGVAKARIRPFKIEAYSLDALAVSKGVETSELGVVTAIFSVPKRTLALSTYEPKWARKNGRDVGEIAALVSPSGANLRYRWERKTSADATWEPIPGAVSSVYQLTENDVDAYLRVVVRGEDAKLGEIVAETKAAVAQTRGATPPSVVTGAGEKFDVDLADAALVEDQIHTTLQIYYLPTEEFQRLTENR